MVICIYEFGFIIFYFIILHPSLQVNLSNVFLPCTVLVWFWDRSFSSEFPQLPGQTSFTAVKNHIVIVFLFVSEMVRAGLGLIHLRIPRVWHCAWCIIGAYVELTCEIVCLRLLHLLDWEPMEGNHSSTLYRHVLASCHAQSHWSANVCWRMNDLPFGKAYLRYFREMQSARRWHWQSWD